ncbi:MAG: hypothetical protein ABW170_04765 [Candidatus Thiodiazotropha sp. L084R]
MTRTAGALIGRRRSSAFWGLGCPKTHHEIKDSLVEQKVYSHLIDLLEYLSTVHRNSQYLKILEDHTSFHPSNSPRF